MSKTTRPLFSILIAGSYTLDSPADCEFLADLCQPLPFVPADADMPKVGTLAKIPAAQYAAIVAQIDETTEYYLDEIYGNEHDEIWADASRVSCEILRDLRADLAAL